MNIKEMVILALEGTRFDPDQNEELLARLDRLIDGKGNMSEVCLEHMAADKDHCKGCRIATLEAQIAERDREIESLLADKARLDWLEADEQCGAGLLSDDFGNWAVSGSGFQNITDENDKIPSQGDPIDIQSTFFVEKDEWRESIREAIDAAKGEG